MTTDPPQDASAASPQEQPRWRPGRNDSESIEFGTIGQAQYTISAKRAWVALDRQDQALAALEADLKALRTENETLSAKAALLSRYCGWIRWRRTHGAFGGGEQELLDAFDAIDAGQTFEYPDHWVRDALTPPIDGEGAAGVMSETWKFEPWGVPELGLVKLWDENGKEVGVIASAQQASRIIAAHNGGLVQALRETQEELRAYKGLAEAFHVLQHMPMEVPVNECLSCAAVLRAALTALEEAP
jgi:hypothetical protein